MNIQPTLTLPNGVTLRNYARIIDVDDGHPTIETLEVYEEGHDSVVRVITRAGDETITRAPLPLPEGPEWRKVFVERGGSLDSDRVVTCPACGHRFDGEVHTWEAGQEECPECDHVFDVTPE